MGEAAEILTMESAAFAASPAFQLRVVREHEGLELSNEERALVDLLEATYMRGWVDALAGVAPARAADLAVELWASTAAAWRLYLPKLTLLLETHGLLRQPIPEGVLALAQQHLPTVDRHLPHLPPNALAYVRAFAGVVADQLKSEPDTATESVQAIIDGEWPNEPEFDDYMGLLHGLVVAGLEERIPNEVATALAVGFWARLRALAKDASLTATMDTALRAAVREVRDTRPIPNASSGRLARHVLVRVREIGASVPDAEWAAVPTDASRHLDRYLYGAGR